MATVILNKNMKKFKNNAIKTSIILVIITIVIPIMLLNSKVELNMSIIPLFIILYIFFGFLNNNAHKLYLNKRDKNIKEQTQKSKYNIRKIIKYSVILLLVGILLFIVGELLGNTLETLCKLFDVSEMVIGILLGFITSIPELITFFESQKHHKKVEDDMLGVVEATNNLLTSNTLNLFIIQVIGILMVNVNK